MSLTTAAVTGCPAEKGFLSSKAAVLTEQIKKDAATVAHTLHP